MPNVTTTLALTKFSAAARRLVTAAQTRADDARHAEVSPLHLLAAAVDLPPIAAAFGKAGADDAALRRVVERMLATLATTHEAAYLSSSLLALLERAEKDCQASADTQVTVGDLLNALCQEIRGPVAEVLTTFGLGPGSLRPYTSSLDARLPATSAGAPRTADGLRDWVALARSGDPRPVIGRTAEVRRTLTVLERHSKNCPVLVGEPGVGKRAIARALAARIAGGDVPTSLADCSLLELDVSELIAGARVRGELQGRVTALIERLEGTAGATLFVPDLSELFLQAGVGTVMSDLFKASLLQGRLRMIGTITRSGWKKLSEREPALCRALTVVNVDEPSVEQATEIVRGLAATYERHHAVEISEGAITASVQLAKRYVQEKNLPDSALDLLDEAAARQRVEQDGIPSAMDTVLRRVESLRAQIASLSGAQDATTQKRRAELESELQQLSPEADTIRGRLDSRRGAVAAARALRLELDAAKAALREHERNGDRARAGEIEHVTLPSLVERVAKADAAAQTLVGATGPLSEGHVAATLAEWTGIPAGKMLEEEAQKLMQMEERLSQRVVGQSAAIEAIARAVRRARVGLRDPRRPIGSFLFLGPSGVGKTELAKALAEFLFDDEQALTRLDMSEFMERHMAQRLLGAPPGYADSEEGGFLTEAVRRRPYSVLLFDEVEKAHADVFNLLLQLLDDGRLTDGRGRVADFSNTVVILTSNIGAKHIADAPTHELESEAGTEELFHRVRSELGAFFRPEFLNRIGETVLFRPLGKPQLAAIVDIQIRKLAAMLGPRRISIHVDESARSQLVDLGYNPALGARPVQRVIAKYVQDPLAESLLSGKCPEGATLALTFSMGEFTFEPRQ